MLGPYIPPHRRRQMQMQRYAAAGAVGIPGAAAAIPTLLKGAGRLYNYLVRSGNTPSYSARVANNKVLQRQAASSGGSSRRYVKKKPTLKKQVKEIKRVLNSQRAIHVHRVRTAFDLDAAVNSIAMNSTAYTIANLESAMANLRYFDPGTNALVTASPASGTYSREILVKKVVYKIIARNNYQVPCRLTLYACRPKIDTSVTPSTYFFNGLTDQGNPTNTSQLVHLTDSQEFKDAWSIEKSKQFVLKPGEEVSMYHSLKPFSYDFSLSDTHTLSYQRKANGFSWIQRVEGILGHDTIADEQGFLAASCDFAPEVKYEFNYDAGKDLHDISISDNVSTFTNAGVVSNCPVSDNQQFSAS